MHAARTEYQQRSDTPAELKIEREEEVHRLLESLDGPDAELIRAFYIDRKSYSEISREIGIPENSIGPTLTRLREQLRKTASRYS
jgi:RNA polymerase sigma-70 factor (ECF subfamily)